MFLNDCIGNRIKPGSSKYNHSNPQHLKKIVCSTVYKYIEPFIPLYIGTPCYRLCFYGHTTAAQWSSIQKLVVLCEMSDDANTEKQTVKLSLEDRKKCLEKAVEVYIANQQTPVIELAKQFEMYLLN